MRSAFLRRLSTLTLEMVCLGSSSVPLRLLKLFIVFEALSTPFFYKRLLDMRVVLWKLFLMYINCTHVAKQSNGVQDFCTSIFPHRRLNDFHNQLTMLAPGA